jgi:hypothetical protein
LRLAYGVFVGATIENKILRLHSDASPLKSDAMVLAGLRPDSQRYFDHHHASNDTFDAVNKRELELGAATMTSLVYLFDKYGVNPISNLESIKN